MLRCVSFQWESGKEWEGTARGIQNHTKLIYFRVGAFERGTSCNSFQRELGKEMEVKVGM